MHEKADGTMSEDMNGGRDFAVLVGVVLFTMYMIWMVVSTDAIVRVDYISGTVTNMYGPDFNECYHIVLDRRDDFVVDRDMFIGMSVGDRATAVIEHHRWFWQDIHVVKD